VNSFAFSPDERYLVSGSADKTVRVLHLATGEPCLIIPVDEPVAYVNFTEKGERILAVQKSGVARTFPIRHMEWFKFACQILRGVPQVYSVRDEDRQKALSACPPG
jgi:WD40 repeat protein